MYSERKIFQLFDHRNQRLITVEAERAGSEWRALCPFHNDHTPSLFINEEKGVYYCHSNACDAKGKIYDSRQ